MCWDIKKKNVQFYDFNYLYLYWLLTLFWLLCLGTNIFFIENGFLYYSCYELYFEY